MNSGWIRVVTLVATLGLASCIAHRPTRTFDEVNHVEPRTECLTATAGLTSIAKLSVQGSAGDPERVRVGCMSDEDHEPEQGRFPHSGFKLHVFEFDDDGVPWNAEGQRASLEKLTKELNDRRSLVAAFVHGWKNDAEVCNDNLACFREVLRLLAKGETSFAGPTARQVVGVYIGWRGGTIRAKGVKQLTFWGRKHTAHAIGDNGAVTAVIERLRTIVDESKKKRSTSADTLQDTSMVFVGHSFGAALLFSALSTSLNASVGRAIQRAELPTIAATSMRREQAAQPPISAKAVCVDSAEDLVVLVNPAMEASRFANLAQTRNLAFDNRQVPIFMTLASEADGAVGGFFPVGQAFATVSRAARSRDFWLRMEKGFGLYEPYLTHRIVAAPGAYDGTPLPTDPPKTSDKCACKSNLRAVSDDILAALQPLYKQLRDLRDSRQYGAAIERLRLAAYVQMLGSRLEPVRDVDPNNPFVMASIDPAVVNGHSDIFNARFLDFLIEYVVRSEIKRSLLKAEGTGCGQ
jgi:hypothetical protein